MKMKQKFLKSIAALILGSAALTSCLEDPEPVILDALPDVFMQKVVQDTVTKYGISFWILANKDLDSVKVNGPGNKTWALKADDSNNRVFNFFPEPDDYLETIPLPGDYTFTVTSTQPGEAPRTFKDKLEEEELETMTLDTVFFHNGKMKISWEELESVDVYFVRMYDESKKLIFLSPGIDNEDIDYSFGLYDTGWTNSNNKAVNGEEYKLEVIGLLFESDATTANKDYNVQCMSIASTEITWGD